ncbi:MAG: hypothetical protein ABSE98_11195 [Acidimicrobiales bacterium]
MKENLAARSAGRAAGVGEDRLTPALSWSPYSLSKRWNESKDQVAPWWREVSMLSMRFFECQSCGASLDRDVNAAPTAPGREHVSSPSREVPQSSTSRGLRPETQDADLRSRQTSGAQA